MQNDPLVSLLIPLYNAEKYFKETVDSLLAQTYKNIEIIIVNDGSTDSSLKIAKSYEKKYEHIKVFSHQNCGAAATRNRAFKESSGEFIQYFDADDIMHKDKINLQMNILKKYNYQKDIVCNCKWLRFYNTLENTSYLKKTIEKDYENTLLFLQDAWIQGEYMIGPSWIISRELNEKIGAWNEGLTFNDDGEFFMRVAYNASKIVYVEDSIVYYRQDNENSISSDFSIKSIRSHLKSYYLYETNLGKDIEQFDLKYAMSKLYSNFYRFHFPLNKSIKTEIYNKLNTLGFKTPLIEVNPKIKWLVNLFGIDLLLYLRILREKIRK